jgi:serine phosphatase RsbU (regulator of sigma subunit)
VLAAPGQRTELLDVQVGPPLGIVDLPRRTRRVSMPLGALLLLYTDGLVERRDESIERGLHRLRAAVHAESAEQVCRTVMRQLVGGEPVADDIALLAVHRT